MNKYSDKLIHAYETIYLEIMEILVKLDYLKYKELYTKYHDKIEKLKEKKNISIQEIDNIYSLFLTEYYHYIINLSNKSISEDTLYKALRVVKVKINGYSEEELNVWEQKTKENNHQTELRRFPYIYNPNETRLNYLSDVKVKVRTKTTNNSS